MNERLFRSKEHRVVGGVAGGLGEYLNIDPIIVRIIFIIITFLNGIGLLVYIVLWIVVPEQPLEEKNNGNSKTNNDDTTQPEVEIINDEPVVNSDSVAVKKQNGNGRIYLGIVLIGLGVIFLAERFFPYFDFEDMMPMILIVVGIALLANSLKNKKIEK